MTAWEYVFIVSQVLLAICCLWGLTLLWKWLGSPDDRDSIRYFSHSMGAYGRAAERCR